MIPMRATRVGGTTANDADPRLADAPRAAEADTWAWPTRLRLPKHVLVVSEVIVCAVAVRWLGLMGCGEPSRWIELPPGPTRKEGSAMYTTHTALVSSQVSN